MTELLDLAKSTYNRAFDLVVEGSQTDLLDGLELAATSLHLWRQVGTAQNEAIGLWLYSRALHKSGADELAIEAASRGVSIAEMLDVDWLYASALEGLTRASQGTTRYSELRELTQSAISAISDDEDRSLIASQFADLH
jgi:hypothetical protein